MTPSSSSAVGSTRSPRARARGLGMHGVGIEQPQRQGEAAVGLGRHQAGRCRGKLHGECGRHQAGLGAGRLEAREVLAVVEKRKVVPRGVGQRAHVRDGGCRINVGGNLGVRRLGDVRQRERSGPVEEPGMLHAEYRRGGGVPFVWPRARLAPEAGFGVWIRTRTAAATVQRAVPGRGADAFLASEAGHVRTLWRHRSGRTASRRRFRR